MYICRKHFTLMWTIIHQQIWTLLYPTPHWYSSFVTTTHRNIVKQFRSPSLLSLLSVHAIVASAGCTINLMEKRINFSKCHMLVLVSEKKRLVLRSNMVALAILFILFLPPSPLHFFLSSHPHHFFPLSAFVLLFPLPCHISFLFSLFS